MSDISLGLWAIPTIVVNVIFFVMLRIHKKTGFRMDIIKQLNNFEISKKTTTITILLLLGTYLIISFHTLEEQEDYSDSKQVLKILERGEIGLSAYVVHYFLTVSSFQIFGNAKIFSLLGSLGLFILVYFFVKDLSGKRLSGIVSIGILIQSSLFLEYSLSYTYPIFWIILYLVSLYVITKKWYFSAPVYTLSLFAKPFIVLFLPMTIYFIHKSKNAKNQKYLFLSYGLVITVGLVLISLNFELAHYYSFDKEVFITGFKEFSRFMKNDWLITVFLIPTIVGLFLKVKQGIRHADSIMFLIAGSLFSFPLIAGFSDITNQPYRFTPLVIFFAMAVGILLAKPIKPTAITRTSFTVFVFSILIASMTSVFILFPNLIEGSYRLIL